MWARVAVSITILLLFLAVWMHVNSQPGEKADDSDLLEMISEVNPEENGYEFIRHIENEDSNKYWFDNNSTYGEIIRGESWDLSLVRKTLKKNHVLLDEIKKAINKPYISPWRMTRLDENIPVSPLLFIFRLNLVKARYEIQNFDYDEAISSLDIAIRFCSKLQADRSGSYLAYALARVCITDAAGIIHDLTGNFILSQDQLGRVLQLFDNIPGYENDAFDIAIAGEYVTANRIWSKEKNKINNIKEFIKSIETMNTSFNRDEWEFTLTDKIYYFLVRLFPDFYVNTNNFLDRLALNVREGLENAGKSCQAMTRAEEQSFMGAWKEHRALADIFRAGSFSEYMAAAMGTEDWDEQYLRRCHYHNYISAIRVIVAIKAFEAGHGKLPDTLDQLVPEYLVQIPGDKFSADKLRYSYDDRWVYSLGENGFDNHGEVKGFYIGNCVPREKWSERCDINPTIPIDRREYEANRELVQ